jgi:hypothetical protein
MVARRRKASGALYVSPLSDGVGIASSNYSRVEGWFVSALQWLRAQGHSEGQDSPYIMLGRNPNRLGVDLEGTGRGGI